MTDSDRTYLGIDIGTSAVKVVLMNSQKELIAQSCEKYDVSELKEGHIEIDPEIWFQSTEECLHRIFKDQNAECVSVIGITGQMHSLAIVDERLESIRPVIMWNNVYFPGSQAENNCPEQSRPEARQQHYAGFGNMNQSAFRGFINS